MWFSIGFRCPAWWLDSPTPYKGFPRYFQYPLAPYVVTAILLTLFPMLYFTSCDYFVTTDSSFLIPLPFSPIFLTMILKPVSLQPPLTWLCPLHFVWTPFQFFSSLGSALPLTVPHLDSVPSVTPLVPLLVRGWDLSSFSSDGCLILFTALLMCSGFVRIRDWS